MARNRRRGRPQRRRRGGGGGQNVHPHISYCSLWEGTIKAGTTIAHTHTNTTVGKNAWRAARIQGTFVCESTKDKTTGLNVSASSVYCSVRGYGPSDQVRMSPVKVVGSTPITVTAKNPVKLYWVPSQSVEHLAWTHNTGNSDMQYSVKVWYTQQTRIMSTPEVIELTPSTDREVITLNPGFESVIKKLATTPDADEHGDGRSVSVTSDTSSQMSII